jgi:transcriptional adapter 3
MAPASKKGTGKASARDRRSSSRHSTPMSALTDTTPGTPLAVTPSNTSQSAPALPRETPYLHTPTAYLISADLDLDTLIERSHPPSLKPHDPPTARELHALHDKIRDKVLKSLEKRGETCERNLRAVVQKRKESAQLEREREAAEQQVAADRIKKEREDGSGKSKKTGQKRSHGEVEGSGDRKPSVPSVGEHMLARQDGVGVHEGKPVPVVVCREVSFCLEVNMAFVLSLLRMRLAVVATSRVRLLSHAPSLPVAPHSLFTSLSRLPHYIIT